MKLPSKLLLFLILLALPVVERLASYPQGLYRAPASPKADTSQVEARLSAYKSFEDKPVAGNGYVIIDLSHANRLAINDLDPLEDRLRARKVTIEIFDDTDGSLRTQLHNASALVVIAPTEKYTDTEELDAIVDFVKDGGHLFIAADPTRPVQDSEVGLDKDGQLFLIPRISAVPATNSLANAFDVSYFEDYLYNVHDNEGNYRNLKFTDFSKAHPLTEGLETVVFYSANSLRSRGLSLVVGDENTLSPLRTDEPT